MSTHNTNNQVLDNLCIIEMGGHTCEEEHKLRFVLYYDKRKINGTVKDKVRKKRKAKDREIEEEEGEMRDER